MEWRIWRIGLGVAGVAALFALLFLTETVVDAFSPNLTQWQSRLITAVMITAVLSVVIFVLLGRQNMLQQTILREEERRRSLERIQQLTERSHHLEQLTRELEVQVKEREQAEEKLAAERNLLRTLINNLPDFIFVKDTESRFIICNTSILQNIKLESPEEILGKRDFDFFPREHAEAYYADEQAVIRTGTPLIGREEMNVGYTGVPRWYSTTKVPLRDGKDQIIGVVGMSRDITARKQAEAALQQARDELEQRVAERTAELVEANEVLKQEISRRQQVENDLATERNLLRTLIDNLPHNIYIRDVESRFITSNATHTQMLGLESEADLIGKTDFDFYPPELANKFFADDMYVLNSGQALINIEEPTTSDDENRVWFLTSKLPLRDQHGRIIGLVGIGIDITERKQAEEHRLELALQRERTKGLRELIGSFSHDLKTPLSVINTSIYLLEKTSITDQQRARLEGMKAQVAYLDKLIQDILMISRLDRIGEPELSPANINAILRDLEAKFQALVEKKRQILRFNLDGQLPSVLADQNDLSRALGNLIENAVKYTPEEGTVMVSTFSEDDYAVIQISDTGSGISEQDLPYIFDHFYRTDAARASEIGGTGLGLAIVKKVIEQHHGSISVESVVGRGTAFCVRLPKQWNPSARASS